MSEYYTFTLSENVNRTSVSYLNRYGIRIAADLYTAKDMDETEKHPALVIGPPYGGVKEQGPGVYANQLAQRGFVCLAFDPAFMGESGGEPAMFLHLTSLQRISLPGWIISVHFPLWIGSKSVQSVSAAAVGSLFPQRRWIPVSRR